MTDETIEHEKSLGQVVPGLGKDEMNLVEFPFGPVTQTTTKTLEVEHEVFDKTLNREVTRRLMITGAHAFGLPRPIDDQVLIGMKALTHDAGYKSRVVKFSRYQLAVAIGWEPDGRAYQRLEESFDRIAGTTLKFKDAWWDKGEREWKSKTFHLIEEVNLCSRDELERKRKSGAPANRLCSFVWSDVIWKSFQDGFIKSLDMEMFRRIARGLGETCRCGCSVFWISDFTMANRQVKTGTALRWHAGVVADLHAKRDRCVSLSGQRSGSPNVGSRR